MENRIVSPDAAILVESTRSIGYSFEAALADIIDNSVAKDARNIYVSFDSNEPRYIAIVDDGLGMDLDELINAMKYGSKSIKSIRDKHDLGRFGLGLKMASLSQCRKLTVMTKKNGISVAAQWDLDHIIQVGDWSLKIFSEENFEELRLPNALDELKSGTAVVWENFDRMLIGTNNAEKLFDSKIDIARKHIGLVFHRFITGEDVKPISIYFNSDKIEALDPFLLTCKYTEKKREQCIVVDSNSDAIRVKSFILPSASKLTDKEKRLVGGIEDLRRDQGFYIYRNYRLIIWGTWFGLMRQYELHKLARVRVDIPNTLDYLWDIDVKKSKASLPDAIRDRLRTIVLESIQSSEDTIKIKGRRVNRGGSNIEYTWNIIDKENNYYYMINRESSIYKKFTSKLDETQKYEFDKFLKLIEKSLPVSDIYIRLAGNDDCIKNKEILDADELYDEAMNLFVGFKNRGISSQVAIDMISQIDVFSNQSQIINRLKDENRNDS